MWNYRRPLDIRSHEAVTLIKEISCGAVALPRASFVERVGMTCLVEGTYPPLCRIPQHRHPTSHCTYVCSGSYWETRIGRRSLLREGDLRFHPKGEIHCDLISSTGARCLNIEFFAADPLTRVLEALNYRLTTFAAVMQNNAKYELGALSCPSLLNSAPRAVAREVHAAIETFLWREIRRRLPEWLRDCITAIEETIVRPPSLTDLAERTRLHPTHIIRAFRSYMGQTPGDFVRGSRVVYACKLLAESKAPLSDIGFCCGFYDQPHFSRVFKAHVGNTPKEFRDNQANHERAPR